MAFLELVRELSARTMLGLADRFRIYNADDLNGILGYLEEKDANIVKASALTTAGYPLNRTTEIVVRTA